MNDRTPARRPTTAPPTPPVTPPVQLRLGENPGQLLHRLRAARAAVRGTRRYGLVTIDVFTELAAHTNADGITRASATDLALELDMHPTHVRRALRALAAGGFVIPLERVDGVWIAATRHPRYRAGYLVPGMVAPAPIRPHVVR